MTAANPNGPRPQHKALTRKTIAGSAWSFAGTGVQTLLRIGLFILLSRLLPPADFGVVAIAMVIINFLDLFNLLGVSPAIIQKQDLTDEDVSTALILSVALGTVAGLVIAGLSPVFAAFFHMPQLRLVMPILALNFPLKGLSTIASALLQREMRFREIASVTVSSHIFGYIAVAVTLAYLGWGVWALIYGQLAQTALNSISYLLISRPKFVPKIDPATVRHLMKFGGGYSLSRMGNFVAINGDNFLTGRLLGAVSLGIYSRAYQFLMLPTNLIGNVIDQVFLPAMVKAREDEKRLARAYERAVGVIVMLMLPVSAILVVLAPLIVPVLLGPRWNAAIHPFQFLAATMVCRAGYKVSDTLWKAKGRVMGGAWRQWLYAAEVLFGTWVGSFWGPSGVALCVGMAITLHYIVMLMFARTLTDVSLRAVGLMHLRHFTVAFFCGGAAWLVSGLLFGAGLYPLVVIVVSCVAALIVGIALWFAVPSLFGKEGLWCADQLQAVTAFRKKPVADSI